MSVGGSSIYSETAVQNNRCDPCRIRFECCSLKGLAHEQCSSHTKNRGTIKAPICITGISDQEPQISDLLSCVTIMVVNHRASLMIISVNYQAKFVELIECKMRDLQTFNSLSVVTLDPFQNAACILIDLTSIQPV